MTAPVTPSNWLDGYQLSLPVFEGPLDVLLRLIERNQLAVTDVSLVAVTEQFVAYVAALTDLSAETLADFTAIAARLLVLKSRSLLPAPPVVEEEPETDDLTRRLLDYRHARLAAEELRQRERDGWRAWGRSQYLAPDLPPRQHLAPTPLPGLIHALQRCLNRLPRPAESYAPVPVITLAAMTRRLLARLSHGSFRFTALVGAATSRAEHVVAFIALLSLVRRRAVEAHQSSLFGEIEIHPAAVPAAADD